jgi:hypothetical protein
MAKFDPIVEKHTNKGISTDNIEYAISAVKDGTKREHILENLTADYRGMNHEQGNALLEDLFTVSGGEFKKENRGGYLFGTAFLVVGLSCAFYIFYVLYYDGVLVKPILVALGAFFGIAGGLRYFVKSLKGQYRDHDEPFKE